MTSSFEIVAANRFIPQVPDGLEALRLQRREPQGTPRRLCACGDVGPAEHLLTNGDPLREIAPVLQAADLAFANLETPLLQNLAPGAQFAASADSAELLATTGFGILNLANNHIRDFGADGITSSRESLTEHGVAVLGAGPTADAAQQLVVTDLDGLRVGWLGCARTLEPQPPPGDVFWEYEAHALATAVRRARSEVDVLVASVHMGYMYVDYPHPEQREASLALLDAGADLALLHHAHVLQGIEATEQGVVCYNLGNLLLDWTLGEIQIEIMQEEQRSGGLFVFDLDREGVCALTVLPIRVDDDWTVRWAHGEQGRAVLERLEKISGGWDGEASRLFHRQLSERATGLAVKSTLWELRRGGPRAALKLLRRVKPHHLRMLVGWPLRRIARLRRGSAP